VPLDKNILEIPDPCRGKEENLRKILENTRREFIML
jgi:hypothetical protein